MLVTEEAACAIGATADRREAQSGQTMIRRRRRHKQFKAAAGSLAQLGGPEGAKPPVATVRGMSTCGTQVPLLEPYVINPTELQRFLSGNRSQ
jgi:hypothetical protein